MAAWPLRTVWWKSRQPVSTRAGVRAALSRGCELRRPLLRVSKIRRTSAISPPRRRDGVRSIVRRARRREQLLSPPLVVTVSFFTDRVGDEGVGGAVSARRVPSGGTRFHLVLHRPCGPSVLRLLSPSITMSHDRGGSLPKCFSLYLSPIDVSTGTILGVVRRSNSPYDTQRDLWIFSSRGAQTVLSTISSS